MPTFFYTNFFFADKVLEVSNLLYNISKQRKQNNFVLFCTGNRKLDNLFIKKASTTAVPEDPSISAVVKCVNLVVQHNSFFNILDHLALIIRSEFSDSKVAKKFTSGKTKTAAIVNSIGDYFFEELKSSMEENPFSIMLDGSNDNGLEKMYPITVRMYDVRFNVS